MPKQIDTQGTFDITGHLDFRNARLSIPFGSTVPDIVRANGQLYLYLNGTKNRLYYTVKNQWYYLNAE